MHTHSDLTDADDDDASSPQDTTPIRLALLPSQEWEAELRAGGLTFSYRSTQIATAYASAQKWAPGPTRPFVSDDADAVLARLKTALDEFDALVLSLVAAGCTESEIRLVLDGPYLEDLALRILFGMTRAANSGTDTPAG